MAPALDAEHGLTAGGAAGKMYRRFRRANRALLNLAMSAPPQRGSPSATGHGNVRPSLKTPSFDGIRAACSIAGRPISAKGVYDLILEVDQLTRPIVSGRDTQGETYEVEQAPRQDSAWMAALEVTRDRVQPSADNDWTLVIRVDDE
ncbi:MAG: hypothetical protein VX290_11185, partial [Candidatus Latescibacterota bacterium]|nr:hypothetical protein [Candidatus Latescibacterota bacterium]